MKKMILFLCFFPVFSLLASEWYTETLHPHWGQTFEVEERLFEEKTEHQDLVIFRNKRFGTVLALDGAIQTTEKDEFVYHEMMTHVPLLAHGSARNILIIGGGDGGILRDVLRHQTVERATLVEIDSQVIELSKQYLPSHSNGAFEDPRSHIFIQDGCQFVKECQEKFDVIIVDSTDPIGPGAVLFTSEFYGDCKRLLNDKGILITQSSVPFLQSNELKTCYRNLQSKFNEVRFYTAVVPTYVGGFMTLGFSTDHIEHFTISQELLEQRLQAIEGGMKYYTPSLHHASFALPKFIQLRP